MSSTRIFAAFAAAGLFGFAAAHGASAETVAPDAVSFEEGAVAQPLTASAGDPAEGRKWFVNRKLGNCLACHQNPDIPEQSFHGETAPSLEGVADRYTAAQLRGIVVNSKMTFDGTMMPSFYRVSGFSRPLGDFEGKTILTAQQVEDVVAYLSTLK